MRKFDSWCSEFLFKITTHLVYFSHLLIWWVFFPKKIFRDTICPTRDTFCPASSFVGRHQLEKSPPTRSVLLKDLCWFNSKFIIALLSKQMKTMTLIKEHTMLHNEFAIEMCYANIDLTFGLIALPRKVAQKRQFPCSEWKNNPSQKREFVTNSSSKPNLKDFLIFLET